MNDLYKKDAPQGAPTSRDDGGVYLPPFSARVAHQVAWEVEAIARALPGIVPMRLDGDAPFLARAMADRLARLSCVLMALLDEEPPAAMEDMAHDALLIVKEGQAA